MGVHYVWFHTYRAVGPKPIPELALTPEQVVRVRRFVVEMRAKLPIAIVDAYWDDKGEALCPMATGVSHHISPYGDIEPCPIIQFATENIRDHESVYRVHERARSSCAISARRPPRRRAGASCWSGRTWFATWSSRTARAILRSGSTALAEIEAMQSRSSQHNPGNEIPEDHWAYRFAKKHWFFGFGAYS